MNSREVDRVNRVEGQHQGGMDGPVDLIFAPRCKGRRRLATITAEVSVGVFQQRLGVTGFD